MPALMLNYLGQGALVLAQPRAVETRSTCWRRPGRWWAGAGHRRHGDRLAGADLGRVLGRQQSMQLDFLPRMRIDHTSSEEIGQIYIRAVNWLLLGGVVLTVGVFRSSSAMAAAYGVSVSLLMVITTGLTFFVVRHGWHYPAAGAGGHRGVPGGRPGVLRLQRAQDRRRRLVSAADRGLVYTVMTTWRRGAS
jgi:KUP system potassium uptake protein